METENLERRLIDAIADRAPVAYNILVMQNALELFAKERIKSLLKYHSSTVELHIERVERQEREPLDFFSLAFVWENAKFGHDFWQKIDNCYRGIVRRVEIKKKLF